jgi:hypothetical protein
MTASPLESALAEMQATLDNPDLCCSLSYDEVAAVVGELRALGDNLAVKAGQLSTARHLADARAAALERLQDESPYVPCSKCGQAIVIPAMVELGELRAMRERAERVRDMADSYPSYGKSRGAAAREILGEGS